MVDAVVIGSGPNGLVAANHLAQRGWDVLVLEAADHPGGAVWSSSFVEDGFVSDHCSAFYPLGAGSPIMRDLQLESYGLTWKHSPLVIAHASKDGDAPALSMDMSVTAKHLGVDAGGWRELYQNWIDNSDVLQGAMFTPFPPVKAGLKFAWNKRSLREMLRFARFSILPVRRLGEEYFESEGGHGGHKLLAGLALHADLLPESPLSGFFGWLLASLAQSVGFPVPQGGAAELTNAMIKRLEAHGGVVQCGRRVIEIEVRNSRAVAVRCEDGSVIPVQKAVLADVDAPTLYKNLLPSNAMPNDVLNDLRNFQFDDATIKVDWTLDGPIPWTVEHLRTAGTVHVGEGIDHLSQCSSQLARNEVPETPFMLMGQYSCMDATRQPEGKETAWAYTHVPQKSLWDDSSLQRFADVMQAEIEARAPGFTSLIRKRKILGPNDFEYGNANLVSGALNGGTAQMHQQLVFRPTPGWGRPETPVKGVYLASASAHPGGGVHGACGANAAHAAVLHDRVNRVKFWT